MDKDHMNDQQEPDGAVENRVIAGVNPGSSTREVGTPFSCIEGSVLQSNEQDISTFRSLPHQHSSANPQQYPNQASQ